MRHEKTGLIVPHGDIRQLAKALDWLVQHPEETGRMGAAGVEFIREQFAAAKSMETISAAFENAAEPVR